MGTVVLDASVVIGFLDEADAHNEAARTAIAELHQAGRKAVLPASVLSETLVSAARYGAENLDRVHKLLHQLLGPARVIDEEVAVKAAQLRAAHPALRTPDALVIATGLVDRAETILTGDKRWTGVHHSVRLLGEPA